MRKRILTLVFMIVSALPVHASVLRDFLFPTYTSSGATIVLDRLQGIYLIKPTSRELIFSAQGQSAASLAQQYPTGTVIINAGYFGRDRSGFFPAGHFGFDPMPVDTSLCDNDPNLCGYIFTDELTIHENLTFTKEPTIAAGPVMMLDGVVKKEIQSAVSHRQHKRARTVLIQTAGGPIFLVSKKQVKLDWLLAYIVNTFGRSISVINLDGGSSTTLRTDNPLFQLNITRRLPTFFVLK